MSDLKLSPLVIKLGGAALDCAETLSKLFGAIAQYQNQAQRRIVIVHGGGYLVDDLMAKLQLKSVKKDGLRVTPYDQIPIIMALSQVQPTRCCKAKRSKMASMP